MKDLNNVMLIGRLVRNLELKYTQSGVAIGNGSLAVNSSRKQDGKWVDEVSYFDFVLLGKQAENLKQYLDKGKQVAICGSLRQDRWNSQDGTTHSRVRIIVDNIQLLGGEKKKQPTAKQEAQPTEDALQQAGMIDFSEDIPF